MDTFYREPVQNCPKFSYTLYYGSGYENNKMDTFYREPVQNCPKFSYTLYYESGYKNKSYGHFIP